MDNFQKATRQTELFEIGAQMRVRHLPEEFIASAIEVATEFEGVYDLMKMWEAEASSEESDEIVADIRDMIRDCTRHEMP